MWRRFAVYWTPEGALAEWGRAWFSGEDRHGVDPGVHARAVASAARYGMHATIKPPFAPAAGTSEEALRGALSRFAARHAPARAEGLTVTLLGGFVALRPSGDEGRLRALAASVVRAFDAFRAPPSEAELARRRAAGLTPAQEAMLTRWGYPHVMDEMRFHVTLAGRVSEAPAIRDAAAPSLEPLLPCPFVLDALTLCGEDETGRFHPLARHALAGEG